MDEHVIRRPGTIRRQHDWTANWCGQSRIRRGLSNKFGYYPGPLIGSTHEISSVIWAQRSTQPCLCENLWKYRLAGFGIGCPLSGRNATRVRTRSTTLVPHRLLHCSVGVPRSSRQHGNLMPYTPVRNAPTHSLGLLPQCAFSSLRD